jgi:hypothetical protein
VKRSVEYECSRVEGGCRRFEREQILFGRLKYGDAQTDRMASANGFGVMSRTQIMIRSGASGGRGRGPWKQVDFEGQFERLRFVLTLSEKGNDAKVSAFGC